ncbi:hypothetical protein [Haloferax sp. YSMS24]|uniref:DUF7269 family protein n=1 Tax=Haloferax sp. YSMS24 TaxID=3388425 RepID=UPI00398D2FEC
MTKARSLAYLVGVVATAGGFAIVAGVSLGLELTDLFLTLVAALAAIQGTRYVQRRRDTPTRTTTTGDPELRVEVPVPGADFDDELRTALTRRSRWGTRERLVSRLEQRAQRALVLRDGKTPAEAARLIDDGTWTDDVVAARFLGATISVPIRYRLRLLLSGQSALVARVERTIAAIENVGTDQAHADDDAATPTAASDGGRR